MEVDDLPKQAAIEEIILVDTQVVPTLKGIRKGLPLRIVDHHPLGEDLPPNATYHGEATGATATLFVEQLSQAHVRLSPIEATLLLLGIYEDTGSLSYPATTPRDIRAVLWLLESGGSLDVVDDFLRYPLTEQQRELYDQLVHNLETLQVGGRSIIIATATVQGYVEEISTVAHKLRDLYDPDALFLLVNLGHHIQLVARSTTSSIDVGDVAAYFDGGGHSRASAALIRDKPLEEARRQLIEVLRTRVKPLVTVNQIMSYGVHTLAENATVSEAGDMMRRYGHEGFPVVDGRGRIVGILTRREIDRALHHHLGGAPIRLYMHPGDIHVSSQDSVERVQQVMMDQGLGQVPVVDNGQIVGIVTRTDLIKLWSEPPRRSQAGRIVRLMEDSFPRPLLQLLREVGDEAKTMGGSVYLVGGVVRDLLLGIRNLDLDLVIEADAIQLANRMAERFGGRVRSHSRFRHCKMACARRVRPRAVQWNSRSRGFCYRAHRVLRAPHGTADGGTQLDSGKTPSPRFHDQYPGDLPRPRSFRRAARLFRRRKGPFGRAHSRLAQLEFRGRPHADAAGCALGAAPEVSDRAPDSGADPQCLGAAGSGVGRAHSARAVPDVQRSGRGQRALPAR